MDNTSDLKVGVIQLASGKNVNENVEYIIQELKKMDNNADLVILPEFPFALGDEKTIIDSATSLNIIDEKLGHYIRKTSFSCIIGGITLRSPAGGLYDSMLYFDENGKLITRYDKMHLFSPGKIPNTQAIDETKIFKPGNSRQTFVYKGWKIGVGICFDLRYPEHYRGYFPADLLICTASFLDTTGKAHWELLLRTRALENQAYMIGVNQCSPGYYGHSMVCDPWGGIITEADATPQSFIVTLNKSRVHDVRAMIKM